MTAKATGGRRAPAERRTQAERRASSRARLVDATLECLADRGYAGASLPEIVRRAGLSNGGLWRHFPTKAELLAAASLEAERRLLSSTRRMGAADSGGASAGERVDAVVRQIVAWAEEPAMVAILELLVASRSDPELSQALRAGDERAASMFVEEIHRLLGPELAAHPDFRANVRQLGLMLYGIVATQHLRPAGTRDALTADLRQTLRRLFDLD